VSGIRDAAVAGTFYPAEASALGAAVDELLEGASSPEGVGTPSAIVVPHAGYDYSGPVAASAFALLRGREIARVAILGPAHFVPLRGTAVPSARAWRTPLGEVPIDEELRSLASTCGSAVEDSPHEPEHSLEVQLPFLQRAIGDRLAVLPVAVGVSRAGEVADLIGALRAGAFVVVSTDLSHYQDDVTAKRLDRRTAEAVVARDPDAIGPEDACGVYALRGLVEFARREGLTVRLLDLRTSADTAGDPWRVVGYGAFAVGEAGPAASI
jgi:AmmeMemoRadiSam system protein B